MFAIVETGGKQYKVEKGDILEVERLNTTAIQKDRFTLDHVLLVDDQSVHIGKPYVKNARVRGKILKSFEGPEVTVFKKKSKKQYKRTRIHRQQLHKIEIGEISLGGRDKEEKPAPKKAAPKPRTKVSRKPAAAGKTKTTGKTPSTATKSTKSKTASKPKTTTRAKTTGKKTTPASKSTARKPTKKKTGEKKEKK